MISKIKENSEDISKVLDVCLKLLPLGVALFLMLNFLFNMGYFFPMDIKFISLLELRDYYEGTAPLITISVAILLCFVNLVVYSKLIKLMIKYIKLLVQFLYTNTYIAYKLKVMFFMYFNKLSYSDKKELIEIKKVFEQQLKERKLSKRVACTAFFCIIAALSPFFQFYKLAFHISKNIFWLFCILYLLLIIVCLISDEVKENKNGFLLFFLV